MAGVVKHKGYVQVFTVPGLQIVASQGLASVLGFEWSWSGPQICNKLQDICSIAERGQAFLPKLNAEAARMSMCHSGASPALHSCLIDQDLDHAAQAARNKVTRKASARCSSQSPHAKLPKQSVERYDPRYDSCLAIFVLVGRKTCCLRLG